MRFHASIPTELLGKVQEIQEHVYLQHNESNFSVLYISIAEKNFLLYRQD